MKKPPPIIPSTCTRDDCQNLLPPRVPGTRGRYRLFCSSPCQEAASGKTCTETEETCNRPVRAHGLCARHLKRKDRRENGRPDYLWNDARKDAYHRRRAIVSAGESVKFSEVCERDGWTCHICKMPVLPDLKYPHKRSASLDHVIPISRGGKHQNDNVALAHLQCNREKGNRVA